MTSRYKYCDRCCRKVKKPLELCTHCTIAWKDVEESLQAPRKLASLVKPKILEGLQLLKGLENDITSAYMLVYDAKTKLSNQEDVIAKVLATSLGIKNVELGYRTCEHSPTGICFYDFDVDHCSDNCLMCGQPDERK